MAEGIKIRALQPADKVDNGDVFVVDKLSTIDPSVNVTYHVTYEKLLEGIQEDVVGDFDEERGLHYIAFTPSDVPIVLTVTVRPKTPAHRYFGYDDGFNSNADVAYFINELEAPFLIMVPGITYRFDVSDYSNVLYPMKFFTESPVGSLGGGEEIQDPIITYFGSPGVQNSFIEIKLEGNQSPAIFYLNETHHYMGGQIFDPGSITNRTIQPTEEASLIELSGIGSGDYVMMVSGYDDKSLFEPVPTSTSRDIDNFLLPSQEINDKLDELVESVNYNLNFIKDSRRSVSVLRNDLQTSVENLRSISDSLDDKIENNSRIAEALDEDHDRLVLSVESVRTDFTTSDDEIKQTLTLIQSRLDSMEQQLSRVIQVED